MKELRLPKILVILYSWKLQTLYIGAVLVTNIDLTENIFGTITLYNFISCQYSVFLVQETSTWTETNLNIFSARQYWTSVLHCHILACNLFIVF